MQFMQIKIHKLSLTMMLPELLLFSMVMLFISPARVSAQTECIDGQSGECRCKNVDCLSQSSLNDLGELGSGSDNGEWKMPHTGRAAA